MMREKYNNGQIMPQPRHVPKTRPSAVGRERPTYSASRTIRALHIERGIWVVESLIESDWIETGQALRVPGGMIVGSAGFSAEVKHETLSGLLDLLERESAG